MHWLKSYVNIELFAASALPLSASTTVFLWTHCKGQLAVTTVEEPEAEQRCTGCLQTPRHNNTNTA